MYHFKPTRRAYTMRLTGSDPQDKSWPEALWVTHVAVNQGAKLFGDWLLTFRGGIPADLANDDDLPGGLAHRRNILALSWLSVEDREGAPEEKKYRVPKDQDDKYQTLEVLEVILQEQGVLEEEIQEWLKDCEGSLKASIRKDAIWVNRFRCFKDRQQEVTITAEDVKDFLIHFFGSWRAYFEPRNTDETEGAKNLIIKAGQWLSGRFGSGQGADYERFARIYNAILTWASDENMPRSVSGIETIGHLVKFLNTQGITATGIEDILRQLSGPGYKSGTKIFLEKLHQQQKVLREDLQRLAEKVEADRNNAAAKIGKKGSRPYAEALLAKIESEVGFPYNPEDSSSNHKEYSVMLDHAARRISQTHSWVKRAEATRKAFEEDATKLDFLRDKHKETVEWLEQYRINCAKQVGSKEEYIIRKGAISGWEKIIKKWQECTDEVSRIEAAKILQDDDTIEKFGDINFFIALASEEARCVWEKDGKITADVLKNYVDATVAQHDRQRFKVPAYRHPDPLKHPVFVEFGNSRWSVRYEAHQAVQAQNKKKKSKAQEELDPQKITLTLWDGHVLRPMSLRWQGKRFQKEILGSHFDPVQEGDQTLHGVARKTRFGRTTVGIDVSNQTLKTLQVFSEKDWNARLQVDREILKKLDCLHKKYGKDDHRVKKLIKHLPWFISISSNLQPIGTWEQYISKPEIKDRTDVEFYINAGKKASDRKGLSEIKYIANQDRSDHQSRLKLSRLPGLRILSVDLGIRYGASCTVWETLSTERMKIFCDEYDVSHPSQDDLYYTISTGTKRKLFFRRVAGDTLLDGTPHPAPWARLERQFFIKLQGEEKPTRKPSPEEYQWFESLERRLGITSDDGKKPLRISKLRWNAVSLVKKASKHHNQIASIAYRMSHSERNFPGGRKESLSPEQWAAQVAQALNDLWNLKHPRQPYYQEVNAIWKNHVVPLLPDNLKEKFAKESHADENEETSIQVKKVKTDEQIKRLEPVAKDLIVKNKAQRILLVNALIDFWKKHDDSHFNLILKDLRRHILPQGGKSRKSDRSIRYVGGLSQDRIITITEFRRINDAFSKRPTPDDLQANISKRGEQRKGHFSEQRALVSLERLRENRCKQLASRIVEAALGLGAVKGQTGKRHENPTKYQPCHAIVVEMLDHYRPDELRTRRENRNLMNWSSKQIQKYLAEGCELYGLHLCSISPGYTSRQDYRTGIGGLRCNDYSPQHFLGLNQWSFWKPKIRKTQEKQSKDLTPTEQWLLELWSCWDVEKKIWTDFNQRQWRWNGVKWDLLSPRKSNDPDQPEPVRIPKRGGEIFVSADKNSGSGIHADLNAAANIGLKALADPDWRGSYWKLTVNTATGQPDTSKDEESLLSRDISSSLIRTEMPECNNSLHSRKEKKRASDKINLFSNPSIIPLDDETRRWRTYREYYQWVEQMVIEVLKTTSRSNISDRI